MMVPLCLSYWSCVHFYSIYPDTFLIPSLHFDLIYVGQLCEFGPDLHFSIHYQMQDLKTRKIIGTGRKVGQV